MRMSILLILVLLPLAASAQFIPTWTSDEWTCVLLSDLPIVTYQDEKITLNNFMLKESTSFMSDKYGVLEVSYTASNRTSESVNLNVQFNGADNNDVLIFSLQADPLFDLLSSESSEVVTGNSFILTGTLNSTSKVCAMILVD